MRVRLLIAGAVAAGLGLAAVLVRGTVREALVLPLLTAVWRIAQLIDSLPQSIVWWAVVFAAVVMAARSAAVRPTLAWPKRGDRSRGGRVADWVRAAALARTDDYARWRLAQRVALLACELVAQREGWDIRRARQAVERGLPGVPADVQAYLRAGLGPHRQQGGPLARLRGPRPGDPLALDPARAAELIERILAGQQGTS